MKGRRRDSERRFSLDLAAHLADISRPPSLPDGWQCEVAVALADDVAIGGDFTVFSRNGETLRAMLVDTSGKGAEAATRAIMLAGAIAGLLGELPLPALLPAVNRHVQRVGNDENFATALALELDLRTGRYTLANAGHPPAVHFAAGSGSWALHPVTGPALGLLADPDWDLREGRLSPGDVLLALTDGVIEEPRIDLELGLDRFLGQAHDLVLRGWTGGAQRLLAGRKHAGSDDAQVLLLHRTTARTEPARRPPAQAAGSLLDPYAGEDAAPTSTTTSRSS